MSIHSFQNMISFPSEGYCMWDKYRHESKQTICIIGVLILSAKLCKADGHFSAKEEEEILKIVPHESHQKKVLSFLCPLRINCSNNLIWFFEVSCAVKLLDDKLK